MCASLAILAISGCTEDNEMVTEAGFSAEVAASSETAKTIVLAIALDGVGEEMAALAVKRPDNQATQICIASYLYLQNWTHENHNDFLKFTGGTGDIAKGDSSILGEAKSFAIVSPIVAAFESCM